VQLLNVNKTNNSNINEIIDNFNDVQIYNSELIKYKNNLLNLYDQILLDKNTYEKFLKLYFNFNLFQSFETLNNKNEHINHSNNCNNKNTYHNNVKKKFKIKKYNKIFEKDVEDEIFLKKKNLKIMNIVKCSKKIFFADIQKNELNIYLNELKAKQTKIFDFNFEKTENSEFENNNLEIFKKRFYDKNFENKNEKLILDTVENNAVILFDNKIENKIENNIENKIENNIEKNIEKNNKNNINNNIKNNIEIKIIENSILNLELDDSTYGNDDDNSSNNNIKNKINYSSNNNNNHNKNNNIKNKKNNNNNNYNYSYNIKNKNNNNSTNTKNNNNINVHNNDKNVNVNNNKINSNDKNDVKNYDDDDNDDNNDTNENKATLIEIVQGIKTKKYYNHDLFKFLIEKKDWFLANHWINQTNMVYQDIFCPPWANKTGDSFYVINKKNNSKNKPEIIFDRLVENVDYFVVQKKMVNYVSSCGFSKKNYIQEKLKNNSYNSENFTKNGVNIEIKSNKRLTRKCVKK
jgi:hypothetical protein